MERGSKSGDAEGAVGVEGSYAMRREAGRGNCKRLIGGGGTTHEP